MLYAGRMGESAHSYQSPSKDLKYINSRIAAHSQQPPIAPAAPPEADAVSLCACYVFICFALCGSSLS